MASPGVFSQPLAQYSKKTKAHIKELLRESGVNCHYQRDIERSLHLGTPLEPAKTTTHQDDILFDDLTSSPETYSLQTKWQSKRSKNTIQEMKENSVEDVFVPKPPKYDTESKERCQDLMANEGWHPTAVEKKRQTLRNHKEVEPFSREKHINELVSEIEERVQWLSDMNALDAGDEHRSLIYSQIALKIRDLEFLDEKKTKTFRKLYSIESDKRSTKEGE